MSVGKWSQADQHPRTAIQDEQNRLVANFFDPADARACVEAHNAAIDRAGERGERVSDADLVKWAKEATHGCWEDNLVLDLRDARSKIATLRKALAAARRDGWIAGRDAAAVHVGDLWLDGVPVAELAQRVRALTPPNIVGPTAEGE